MASSPASTANISVKLSKDGDTRLISLLAPPSFKALSVVIKQHYKVQAKQARVTYVDADGDRLTIYDDQSFTAAVDFAASTGKALKLEVASTKGHKHGAAADEDDDTKSEAAIPETSVPAPAPATAAAPSPFAAFAPHPPHLHGHGPHAHGPHGPFGHHGPHGPFGHHGPHHAPPPPPSPFGFGFPPFFAPHHPAHAPTTAPATTMALPPGFTLTREELAAVMASLHEFLHSDSSPLRFHQARASMMAKVGSTVMPFAMANMHRMHDHLAVLVSAVRAGIVLPVVSAAFGSYPRLHEAEPLIKSLLAKCGYDDAVIATAVNVPADAPTSFADMMASVASSLHQAAAPVDAAVRNAWSSVAQAFTPPSPGAGAGAGSAPAVHERVECDRCGVAPIVGVRFKCSVCPNFDLCSSCESSAHGHGHDASHSFLKIATPGAAPAAIITVIDERDKPADEGVPGLAVHLGITCDGCGMSPLMGARSKCSICPDFDLCAKCVADNTTGAYHDASHAMYEMEAPAVLTADTNPNWRHQGPFAWGRGGRHHPHPHPHFRHHSRGSGAEDSDGGRRHHCQRFGGGSGFGSGWRGRGGGGRGGSVFGGWNRAAWDAAAAADLRNPAPTATATATATGAPVHPSDEDAEETRLLELAMRESLSMLAVAAKEAGPSTSVDGAVAEIDSVVTAPAPTAAAAAAGGAGGVGVEEDSLPSAKFVAHLTLADRCVVTPGAKLVKAWRMRNLGTTAWPAGSHLLLVGGDDLQAPVRFDVPSVAAGSTIDIAIPLVAPTAPGRYQTYFRLAYPSTDADGRTRTVRFGHRVWADIFVEAAPTSPSATASTTAEATVPLLSVPAPASPVTPASTVSAGGARVESGFVTAANGNSNAAAVLAALAAGRAISVPATAPPSVAVPDVAPWVVSTPVALPVVAPVVADRWAAHQETLESMGFGDRALNDRLLTQYDGNLMRVINTLVETAATAEGARV